MSFNLLHFLKSGEDLPREAINFLYEYGAFLILKDLPRGSEFGIDYKSWTTDEKFMGLKMIPPGVHFVYCSIKTAPRIGFFHTFKSKDVVVKKWDKEKETFSDAPVSEEEIERFRTNLKTIDNMLGPYPFENYRSWYALAEFVDEETVNRLQPLRGKITAQAELITMESSLMENAELNANVGCSNSVDREHPTRTRFVDQQGLPIMHIREGYQIRFSAIPQLKADKVGIDYSDRLSELLQKTGSWKALLAELQFAFVTFLVGQVFEGFEQWKRLIHLLCCCPRALQHNGELFISFIRVIFFQLKECPSDFFVDIVSRDNFLTTTLSLLFQNIKDNDNASEELKKKSLQFKAYLTKTFKWDFNIE